LGWYLPNGGSGFMIPLNQPRLGSVKRKTRDHKILLVFGTRPEAIKMAPVFHQLSRTCNVEICLTAQHRQMLDQVMAIFGMDGNYDLDIMSPDQSLTEITRRVLEGLEDCYRKATPDFVFVHGDTTTTFAASLAAFYQQIPVCHVEAGLRTGNIYSPFPEEMNRRLTSAITTYHFAPQAVAAPIF